MREHEPSLALRGGDAGLDVIDALLQQAPAKLRDGGAIFLEIGWRQGRDVFQQALNQFPAAHVSLRQDLAGHDRFVIVQL